MLSQWDGANVMGWGLNLILLVGKTFFLLILPLDTFQREPPRGLNLQQLPVALILQPRNLLLQLLIGPVMQLRQPSLYPVQQPQKRRLSGYQKFLVDVRERRRRPLVSFRGGLRGRWRG